MFANGLVAGEPNAIPLGDPQTPVFYATAGQATRMHVLNGASADRDGTFVLHGHLWQRDPFVCTGNVLSSDLAVSDPTDAAVPLPGRCGPIG